MPEIALGFGELSRSTIEATQIRGDRCLVYSFSDCAGPKPELLGLLVLGELVMFDSFCVQGRKLTAQTDRSVYYEAKHRNDYSYVGHIFNSL